MDIAELDQWGVDRRPGGRPCLSCQGHPVPDRPHVLRTPGTVGELALVPNPGSS